MFDDVETKSLFVGYGFAAIVTKAIFGSVLLILVFEKSGISCAADMSNS